MDEKLDHLKGRMKEKAGWLTDDRGLERAGKRDQVTSDAEKTVDDASDVVKRGVDHVSDPARTKE